MISPEGCANILWRDAGKAPEAAENLKLTAVDVCSLGVVERIIPEVEGNTEKMMESLSADIRFWYRKASDLSPGELTAKRYERFRRLGTPRE